VCSAASLRSRTARPSRPHRSPRISGRRGNRFGVRVNESASSLSAVALWCRRKHLVEGVRQHIHPATAVVTRTHRYDGYGKKKEIVRPPWGLFTILAQESRASYTGSIREWRTVSARSVTARGTKLCLAHTVRIWSATSRPLCLLISLRRKNADDPTFCDLNVNFAAVLTGRYYLLD
jgi:hypothetical protein